MEVSTAIETSGTIDEEGFLHLDTPIGSLAPGRVRVILMPENEGIEEAEWLQAASHNDVFAFLNDPSADIYKVTDAKPFNG
ncbi:MAG: hypothetical protein ABIQ44_04700 [Chloroflexia bacterium]